MTWPAFKVGDCVAWSPAFLKAGRNLPWWHEMQRATVLEVQHIPADARRADYVRVRWIECPAGIERECVAHVSNLRHASPDRTKP